VRGSVAAAASHPAHTQHTGHQHGVGLRFGHTHHRAREGAAGFFAACAGFTQVVVAEDVVLATGSVMVIS
jgi:hypothetical protein